MKRNRGATASARWAKGPEPPAIRSIQFSRVTTAAAAMVHAMTMAGGRAVSAIRLTMAMAIAWTTVFRLSCTEKVCAEAGGAGAVVGFLGPGAIRDLVLTPPCRSKYFQQVR